MLAHAEGLNRFAAVACSGAEHAQQAVAFKAGAGAEAALRLPVHLAADMLADDVCRIRNADHNTLEVNLLQVADNLVGHFNGIVKHIKACFAGTTATAEGHYQNICIVKLAVFTGADFGVVTAKSTADTVVQIQCLCCSFFLKNINQYNIICFTGLDER